MANFFNKPTPLKSLADPSDAVLLSPTSTLDTSAIFNHHSPIEKLGFRSGGLADALISEIPHRCGLMLRNQVPPICPFKSPRSFGVHFTASHIFDLQAPNDHHSAIAAPARRFLRFCDSCNRDTSEGHDIYIYRGEKGFCSDECRSQWIQMEEGFHEEDDRK